MKDIFVFSQKELDDIPADYNGRILIKFGDKNIPAVVRKRYRFPVAACGDSTVTVYGGSVVTALDKSVARASGNSIVMAYGDSMVMAMGNSTITSFCNSTVEAWDKSMVTAFDDSKIASFGHSTIDAYGNSTITAWDESTITACGNVQILDRTSTHKIATKGNARVIFDPRNIEEYASYNGIEIANDKILLYKAVHKINGLLVSDNDNDFVYRIGETAQADRLDTDARIECGHGIHMAYKEWCVDYGFDWDDLSIIEVEADASSVIVPFGRSCKVRAQEVRVIREVPFEECGTIGKAYANMHRSKKQKVSEKFYDF